MILNFPILVLAALVPMIIGFIWYNPKVFGNAWMKAAGMTDEQVKGGNMAKIFGLALLFAIMLALAMPGLVIHQMGAFSLAQGEVPGILPSYDVFMSDWHFWAINILVNCYEITNVNAWR